MFSKRRIEGETSLTDYALLVGGINVGIMAFIGAVTLPRWLLSLVMG